MALVVFDRKWEINSKEDYDNAIKELDDNEMCAEMSDDFMCWQREKAEVARQRAIVDLKAKEKGII